MISHSNSSRIRFGPFGIVLGLIGLFLGGSAFGLELTALDRYVAKPDTNYQYHLVNTVPGEGYTAYVLEMTSQAWLTTNEVNRPIWKHWLSIVKPTTVSSS